MSDINKQQVYKAPLSNPDNSADKQHEYIAKFADMTDDKLYDECRSKIWFSAFAANNSRSCYHWQVDACYDECKRRGKIDEVYSRAHKAEMQAAGY